MVLFLIGGYALLAIAFAGLFGFVHPNDDAGELAFGAIVSGFLWPLAILYYAAILTNNSEKSARGRICFWKDLADAYEADAKELRAMKRDGTYRTVAK